jgi:glycosyltransferase involved in cell wall biosynthesis
MELGNDGFPCEDIVSRKKLLILSSTYPRWLGDPEPGFVHELAKRLTTQFDIRVLCPHARGAATQETLEGVEVTRYRYAPSRLETLVNDGGIVTNLKRAPWKWLLVPFFLLGLFWRAWREMHRWRPDVIHAHWLLPQGLVVALLDLLDRRAPPFLVTSHGADLFALRAHPLTALKRFVARRAAALTVVSQAMTDELARIGISLDKVSVQPMGVDFTQRFTPASDLPRSRDEILFVGRLVEKKGLRYLLAALPEIIARHPSAFLTVVGFGPEEGERGAQAEALGIAHQVHFLGARAQVELPALYRRAAVFVAPFVQSADGDREGLGLVTVEAIACGCPVVVSALPAVLDLLDPKTDAAALVPPGNVAELAARITAALAAPEQARSKARELRERLQQSFDWQTIASRYATLLGSIGQGHG